ncbi:unnamed protein product [Mytilus edulis]|uniref:Uncharacterized protein n=1 Tax=Mytilus edulis TaxID=6550 RepID=A0A8S3UNY6_MYTED|nr:unnamed protein product [Mytilus edulis]
MATIDQPNVFTNFLVPNITTSTLAITADIKTSADSIIYISTTKHSISSDIMITTKSSNALSTNQKQQSSTSSIAQDKVTSAYSPTRLVTADSLTYDALYTDMSTKKQPQAATNEKIEHATTSKDPNIEIATTDLEQLHTSNHEIAENKITYEDSYTEISSLEHSQVSSHKITENEMTTENLCTGISDTKKHRRLHMK